MFHFSCISHVVVAYSLMSLLVILVNDSYILVIYLSPVESSTLLVAFSFIACCHYHVWWTIILMIFIFFIRMELRFLFSNQHVVYYVDWGEFLFWSNFLSANCYWMIYRTSQNAITVCYVTLCRIRRSPVILVEYQKVIQLESKSTNILYFIFPAINI